MSERYAGCGNILMVYNSVEAVFVFDWPKLNNNAWKLYKRSSIVSNNAQRLRHNHLEEIQNAKYPRNSTLLHFVTNHWLRWNHCLLLSGISAKIHKWVPILFQNRSSKMSLSKCFADIGLLLISQYMRGCFFTMWNPWKWRYMVSYLGWLKVCWQFTNSDMWLLYYHVAKRYL